MKAIKNRDYFTENGLPLKMYYDQFETARQLEVDNVYYRHNGIYWEHYRILMIGHGVAVAEQVANGNNNFCLGGKIMVHSEGMKAGWPYGEQRACYRLVKGIQS